MQQLHTRSELPTAVQTNAEKLRVRFDPQLNLLRQLFSASDLRFGNPEDLASIAKRLDVPGAFADDARALLTAVIRTEQPTLTRMELLDLLCLAVYGSGADDSGEALRPALWQIVIFINDVLLSSRQATLSETVLNPARSTQEAPQIESFEQNSYILERFDLPSELLWVVSGRDAFDNDLEDIRSLDTPYVLDGTYDSDGTYKPYSVDDEPLARRSPANAVSTKPIPAASAGNARGPASGSSGDSEFETIRLDERATLPVMPADRSTGKEGQVTKAWPRRAAHLSWLASLAFTAIAAFFLGTLVPRYARPCSAAPSPRGTATSIKSALTTARMGVAAALRAVI